MMTQRQKQEQAKQCAATTISSIGIHYTTKVRNSNAASAHLRTLTSELSALGKARAKCTPETTGGYAAELHHKRTFLADAAHKGRRDLDVGLGPRGGYGSQGTADLTVLKNGKPVAEAGLKYRGSAKDSMYDQSNIFDRGRQKVVPKDQLSKVKELSEQRAKAGALKSPDYADTHRNASDRLQYKDIESKPLTKRESMDIVNDPSRYANNAFRNDLNQYTKSGAVSGAAIGAALSLASNMSDVVQGRKNSGEAARHIAKDAVVGGVKGAAIGAGTSIVKQGLVRAGLKQIAKSSAPAAIVSTAFEAGVDITKDVKKLSSGDMDGRTFILNAVGHTASAATKGAGAYSGAQIGATIGLIGGPIGMAAGGFVGGTVGYFASSSAIVAIKRWCS